MPYIFVSSLCQLDLRLFVVVILIYVHMLDIILVESCNIVFYSLPARPSSK